MKKILVLLVMLMGMSSLTFGEDYFKASGIGMAPEKVTHPAKIRILARKAAEMDAYRNLVNRIYGFRLEAQSSVLDQEDSQDDVLMRTAGYLKEVEIVSERFNPDGSYEMEVAISFDVLDEILSALDRLGNKRHKYVFH